MSDDPPLYARLPARFLNGRWETPDGRLLTFAPGTSAVIEVAHKDLGLLGWQDGISPTMPERQFLPVGAKLLFAVSLGPQDKIAKAHLAHLIPPEAMAGKVVGDAKAWTPRDNHFFPVTLGPAVSRRAASRAQAEGGLFVEGDGGGSVKITTGPLRFAESVTELVPSSLNHLLTLLSEVYEVHRAHHTGSIFQRVFYEEFDGKWRSLAYLRGGWAENLDQSFARVFWTAVGQ